MFSDAVAAIGIARRRGAGKIRHLDCTDLWIQEQLRGNELSLNKILGTENPADLLTKHGITKERLHQLAQLFRLKIKRDQQDKFIISSTSQTQEIQLFPSPSSSMMHASIFADKRQLPIMSSISARQKMASSYEQSPNEKKNTPLSLQEHQGVL